MSRRTARSLLLVAPVIAALASCVPPTTTPPATTTTTSTTTTSTTTTTLPPLVIPAFTYQFPSFSLDLPPVNLSFGCSATYNPPAVDVTGPTLSIPATTINQTAGVASLPGVTLQGFSTSVSLGSFTISCPIPFLPPVTYTTGVVANLASGSSTPGATVDIDHRTITVPGSTITLSASLTFQGFGGLNLALPNQNVNLPTVTIPL